jgi:enamine deaminase RidA (YjgF/YER057c/UK114 family)
MRTYDTDGHYSDLVKLGNGSFKLSGIKAWEGTEIKGKTISDQFEIIVDHLKRTLKASELRTSDITFVQIHLADLGCYSEFNKCYSAFFPHKPARAVVGSKLRQGALVEAIFEGFSEEVTNG